MRLITLFSLFVLLALLSCSGDGEDNADTQLYTCGMHPQVIQEGPGICPICNMELTPLKQETASSAGYAQKQEMSHEDAGSKGDKTILYWRAPMDPTYTSDKPGKSPMGMDLVPVYEGEEMAGGPAITIDPVTEQNMGVRTTIVKEQPFKRVIRTVGHIDYDEETLSIVNLKFDGWIEKLFVNKNGELVRKGERLFTVYSPQLVTSQEEYLLAFRNREKLAGSQFSEISDGAKDMLAATRKRLEYWDITDDQIAELEQTGKVKKNLTIYAPATGIVAQKNAVEGAFVKAGQDLFRIANIEKVWVLAHIFEYELPWIRVGQEATMELPYVPGKRFVGKVDFVYPYLDSKTRDVKIRMVFHNPNLELKPQMYANVVIEAERKNKQLAIPTEAIIRSGTRNIVFLALGDGRFEPREVVIGPEGDNGLVQIKSGLSTGQEIVTSAQFMLDSESRLREALQKMLEERKTTAQN